jgi:imidazoleglycerol-phosphate dehydratase
MDETLITTALDLSGRVAFVWKVPIPSEKIGTFDTELAREFWNGVTSYGRMNFHALLHHGENSHHIVEALFKSAARALRQAVTIDPRAAGQVPSTKGII